MFEEINAVKKIAETIEELVKAAVTNKKNFDKKFLLTVVRYQREEGNILVDILNKFYVIYNDAINYVASPECELWFEEVYALVNDNSFADIKHLLQEYTKTKGCKYNMDDVKSLFNCINENKLHKTIELLETVTSYNNFPEEYRVIIKMVIDFISEYHK